MNNQSFVLNAVQHLGKDQETHNRSRLKSSDVDEKPPPAEATEITKQLMEIFSVSELVAKSALKRTEWDLSGAILQVSTIFDILFNFALKLTDESTKSEINMEVEKMSGQLQHQDKNGLSKDEVEHQTQFLPSFLLSQKQVFTERSTKIFKLFFFFITRIILINYSNCLTWTMTLYQIKFGIYC